MWSRNCDFIRLEFWQIGFLRETWNMFTFFFFYIRNQLWSISGVALNDDCCDVKTRSHHSFFLRLTFRMMSSQLLRSIQSDCSHVIPISIIATRGHICIEFWKITYHAPKWRLPNFIEPRHTHQTNTVCRKEFEHWNYHSNSLTSWLTPCEIESWSTVGH